MTRSERVDVAIKDGVTAPIWMTISTEYVGEDFVELWNKHSQQYWDMDLRALKDVHNQTNAQFSVLLSNHRIAWYDGYEPHGIVLNEASKGDVDPLFVDLEAPSSLPEDHENARIEEIERFHKSEFRRPHSDVEIAINTDFYHMDIQKFWEMLEKTRNAEEPSTKGDALEELSTLLFDDFSFFSIKENNMRTTSGEIDIILEYDRPNEGTIFDEYGRYVLVKCKNWNKSVGSKVVRDFTGKMESAKVNLGIIVASNGITGRSGKDAVDELNQYYQRNGSVVVVIDESDLETLIRGSSFYDILDEKIFNRRFRKLV